MSCADSPSKEALKEEVFGPDDAVNGLVWGVTDCANWIALGGSFGLTFKTLR